MLQVLKVQESVSFQNKALRTHLFDVEDAVMREPTEYKVSFL